MIIPTTIVLIIGITTVNPLTVVVAHTVPFAVAAFVLINAAVYIVAGTVPDSRA